MEKIIKAAVDRGASDLHIKAGDVFRARIDGKLVPLTKQRLTPEQTKAIAQKLIANEEDRGRIDRLRDNNCSVTQREIGVDTDDFRTGLRAALRQDPDVILIGEMRDAETIDTAMKAAETGHLLVSTLHTPDAVTTVSRIISMFPPEEQEIARLRLSEALHAVVSQRLLPRADGRGRAAALEMLLATGTARDMIRDRDRTPSLQGYIKESREQYGMQTFDQHLMDLVSDEVVTYETALAASSNPSDFQLQVRTLRRRSRVVPPTEPTPAVDAKSAGFTDDLSGMLPS